jgi:hypothetical protein
LRLPYANASQIVVKGSPCLFGEQAAEIT